MARIKIKDLPKNKKISKDEMKMVAGGFCSDGRVLLKGLGCIDNNHLAGLYDNKSKGDNMIITDKDYKNFDSSGMLASARQTKKK